MEEIKVTYYGHAMFLVQEPRVKMVTDPFDENVGYPLPELEAEVVLISHDHFDHNNAALVKGARNVIKESAPFFMESVKIEGCRSYHDAFQGKKRGENIIFKWHMSGVTFVHMGDYGESELTGEQHEFLSETDVLMIPVGGVYTIDCRKAKEIVELIKPSIAIPMHYKTSCCQININDAGEFVSFFENSFFHTSAVTIFPEKLPKITEVWVLEPTR